MGALKNMKFGEGDDAHGQVAKLMLTVLTGKMFDEKALSVRAVDNLELNPEGVKLANCLLCGPGVMRDIADMMESQKNSHGDVIFSSASIASFKIDHLWA